MMEDFQKIFTRKISSASVTTAKSEEKRLDDEEYVPPPGHISFLKESFSDAHHTYKGDRKKANKGVFKLLRLKSNRLLRNYRKKPPTRIQRCSRCHRVGHNAMNKLCSAGLNVTGDHVEEVQEEAVGAGPA